MQSDLYQAILVRSSVRRYAGEALDAETLARVEGVLTATRPLVPENRFRVLVRDVAPGEDLVGTLGAYGRLVTPPHYLVPYVTGEQHLLVDLGFRVEQIAVRLTALGIGTCYIGSLGREAEVRARFKLPDEARIGAFLVFGWPSESLGGRLMNRLVRRAAGANNKLPLERIFSRETFDAPSAPPAELAPLIEAGRNAPSAVNAQPWRFLWHGGHLYLFVKRRNPRYSASSDEYRLYDGGICLANVALALEALGLEDRWQVLDEGQAGLPEHPETLQPLARLSLGERGEGER